MPIEIRIQITDEYLECLKQCAAYAGVSVEQLIQNRWQLPTDASVEVSRPIPWFLDPQPSDIAGQLYRRELLNRFRDGENVCFFC